MATIEKRPTRRGGFGLLIELAGSQFAVAAVLITIGIPLLAYLWGNVVAMFYVHVSLGAFWFGFDFFFKFIIGPALEGTPDEAAREVYRRLVPKMVVVAEPLVVGVLGSGVALASLLGYWANPPIWLWGAIAFGLALMLVGYGPLHLISVRMVDELASEDPDEDRLEELFASSMKWGLLQTVFMLAIILMMTGLRGIGL